MIAHISKISLASHCAKSNGDTLIDRVGFRKAGVVRNPLLFERSLTKQCCKVG